MTVFDVMLAPNVEKGFVVPETNELIDDAFLFLVAGTGSTLYTLSCAVYYILTHNEVLNTVRAELRQATNGSCENLSWPVLSSLPYLVRPKGSPLEV